MHDLLPRPGFPHDDDFLPSAALEERIAGRTSGDDGDLDGPGDGFLRRNHLARPQPHERVPDRHGLRDVELLPGGGEVRIPPAQIGHSVGDSLLCLFHQQGQRSVVPGVGPPQQRLPRFGSRKHTFAPIGPGPTRRRRRPLACPAPRGRRRPWPPPPPAPCPAPGPATAPPCPNPASAGSRTRPPPGWRRDRPARPSRPEGLFAGPQNPFANASFPSPARTPRGSPRRPPRSSRPGQPSA